MTAFLFWLFVFFVLAEGHINDTSITGYINLAGVIGLVVMVCTGHIIFA